MNLYNTKPETKSRKKICNKRRNTIMKIIKKHKLYKKSIHELNSLKKKQTKKCIQKNVLHKWKMDEYKKFYET